MAEGRPGFLERRDCFSERPRGICPVCFRVIPGVIREATVGLLMEKTCPDHGLFQANISTDLQRYKALCLSERKVTRPLIQGSPPDRGCPDDCGLCPSHEQHTCLAILEITSRCDLNCPVCLAAAGPLGEDLSPIRIEYALKRLMDYEGALTPIQISGGEPTLHPRLIDIVKTIRSLGGCGIELDTNGLALGRGQGLAERLVEAGLSSVYLQMDTLDPIVSEYLRGKDLVETKLQAIENCLKAGLEVVLSVTVAPGINDRDIWKMVEFGRERRLTGVNFQAVTLTGRYPDEVGKRETRFTSGHFSKEIRKQSGGLLHEEDLTPIPCPDPRCGLICYCLIHDGSLLPLTRLLEKNQLIDCLADLKDWPQTLRHIGLPFGGPCCGRMEGPRLDALTKILPRSEFFSIGFHAMMDAYCLDLDRVRRCCVHELTSEGKLVPFCLYNTKYRRRPLALAP